MERYLQKRYFRSMLGVIALLIWTGCVVPTTTPSEDQVLLPVDLTAKEISVQVIREENLETEVAKNSTTNIEVYDYIRLDETGQGALKFFNLHEIDLLRRTEIHLIEAYQEADETIYLRLYQTYGISHIRLDEQSNTTLTLETEYAILKTLESGTEFILCHTTDVITCSVVYEGAVEVTSQGEKEIAIKGEAIYVRPGEPPSSPLCAVEAEVRDWLEKVRGTESVPGLGQIVRAWPQLSCTAKTMLESVEMVKILEGEYMVGAGKQEEFYTDMQNVILAGYWIDQFEVTNNQYLIFLEETGHSPPATWPGNDGHPVKGVDWDDALAYCSWANKRLPTEAEWEAAARGPGPNPPLYPWGDDPLDGGNVREMPLNETYEVGAYPFNQSPFGVFDMAGNVWEWVGDPYLPIEAGHKILRGGRHGFVQDMAFRQVVEPGNQRFIPFSGFRCASDQGEGE